VRTRVAHAEVYASHHQFYVVASGAEHATDLVWDGAGLERHLGVAPGLVAVGTIGHTYLPVTLELWDEEPPLDLDGWDHVVEASLDVPQGSIELHGVEGPAELDPITVEPGSYRLRTSTAGLDGADEMDGGDRYRVQLWPASPAEPEVRKWWPPWDPRGVEPRRTTSFGRILVGAEAEDRRRTMSWLASASRTHLFRDGNGVYWEHSNLPDAAGTPQLEEFGEDEAERRYGPKSGWFSGKLERASPGVLAKVFVEAVRVTSRLRRDLGSLPRDEDGRRRVRGAEAVLRGESMTLVASSDGDLLYRDAQGQHWELTGLSVSDPVLTEVTPDEATVKYEAG
jgi:hypothetical protein